MNLFDDFPILLILLIFCHYWMYLDWNQLTLKGCLNIYIEKIS